MPGKNLQTNNPWLGLRTYPEGITLYGRNKETVELSQKILYNTQTVIYGRSGIGKSSILKAGIFPILRRNNYFPVYVRLVHDNEQDASYNRQIIDAIDTELGHLRIEDLSAPNGATTKEVQGWRRETTPVFPREQEESLWEFFHRHEFFYKADESSEPVTIVPALVFDQFEEIFTLQKDENTAARFFEDLACLINNICPDYLLAPTNENDAQDIQPVHGSSLIKRGITKSYSTDYIDSTNLHLIISLREDFLSHLERNTQNIPLLKHNRYCLLPLNEDQAAEVIMSPAPGLVSVDVAKKIICKITKADPDDFEIDDNPELEVDSAILSLFLSELYNKKSPDADCITAGLVEQFGDNIIPDFYERTVAEISKTAIATLEKRLVTKDGRRDSIYLDQAIDAGVKPAEIDYLLKHRLLRSYSWRDGTRIEFAHDVLCGTILNRRAETERAEQLEALKKAKQAKRRLSITLSIISLTILTVAIFIIDGWFDIKETRYQYMTKCNCWPQGWRELSADETQHLNCHYVFYTKGRYGKPFLVEARNGYGKLTTDHNMATYLVNHFDDSDNNANAEMKEKLATTVKWEFIPDNSGEFCLQEKAYDREGSLIYCYNNTRVSDNRIVSTYTDEYGFPLTMRDSRYIYLRTTLDENGYEALQEFYDDKGFPVTNKDSAYQTERRYFSDGRQAYEASRFVNGKMMTDRVGNCGWEILERNKMGLESLSIYFNDEYTPCRVNDGTMIERWEYDTYGRLTKETYWMINDSTTSIDTIKSYLKTAKLKLLPDTNNVGIHGYILEYNGHGQNTAYCTIDTCGNKQIPTGGNYAEILRDYDRRGNMTSEIALDHNGDTVQCRYYEFDDNDKEIFAKSFSIENGDTTLWYHKHRDNMRNIIVIDDYYPALGSYLHSEYDSNDNQTLHAYYLIENNEPDYDGYQWHKTVTEYVYNSDSTQVTITERYLNRDMKPCAYSDSEQFHKVITVVDSINHTKSIMRYTTDNIRGTGADYTENLDEKFYQGFMNIFDEKFKQKTAETSLGQDGSPCRTYTNETYYYQARLIKSIKPSQTDHIGWYFINEFGEPSLMRNDGLTSSATIRDKHYNEHGKEISENDPRQPLLVAIEDGYGLGFKDGDILYRQDDWTMWHHEDDPRAFIYDLDLELTADKEHKFTVIRFNPKKNDYEFVTITVPAGDERISQLNHMPFYCTKAEEERVYAKLYADQFPHAYILDPVEGGEIHSKGLIHIAYLMRINDWDMSQHFNGNIDSIKSVFERNRKKVKHITVYDIETDEIKDFVIESDTVGVYYAPYYLKPSRYNYLIKKLQNR